MFYFTLAYFLLQSHFWGTPEPKSPIMRIVKSYIPCALPMENKQALAYELELTNKSKNNINIRELRIFDNNNNLVKKYDNYNLQISTKTLDADAKILIYIWLEFPKESRVPTKLTHRINIVNNSEKIIFQGLSLEIPNIKPTILGTPFKDKATWFAANAPSATSKHRTSMPSQRFAVDWMSIDDNGRAFKNNGEKLDDWNGYGKDVVAVADGTIVLMQDNIPENIPGSHRAVPINATTIGGNFLSLELASGEFVVYAHLIPGSLVVQPGDRVQKGQILAKLGNSGNSDAPHLHLHVSNKPEPLQGQGLAYVHEYFETIGSNDNLYTIIAGGDVFNSMIFSKNQSLRSLEMPAENSIVKFLDSQSSSK